MSIENESINIKKSSLFNNKKQFYIDFEENQIVYEYELCKVEVHQSCFNLNKRYRQMF